MALGVHSRHRFWQTVDWTWDHFNPGFEVEVHLVKKIEADPDETNWIAKRWGDWGKSYWAGKRMVIEVSLTKCHTFQAAQETLHHEWSHLFNGKETEAGRHHGPQFWRVYGRIYEKYVDGNGIDESRLYEVTK